MFLSVCECVFVCVCDWVGMCVCYEGECVFAHLCLRVNEEGVRDEKCVWLNMCVRLGEWDVCAFRNGPFPSHHNLHTHAHMNTHTPHTWIHTHTQTEVCQKEWTLALVQFSFLIWAFFINPIWRLVFWTSVLLLCPKQSFFSGNKTDWRTILNNSYFKQ